MEFKKEHIYIKDLKVEFFSEESAPDWLTSKNTIKGSTMDNRWFWENHVLKLKIGESVNTDFHKITRID